MPRTVANALLDNPTNKRHVGLVFQSYALFLHLSDCKNVAFGLRLRRDSSAGGESRSRTALAAFGLGESATRNPEQFPSGQKQRPAISKSLVMVPKLPLLDEPFWNLDESLRLEMRAELR